MKYENSYTRAPGIIALRKHMNETDWLRLLGEEWNCIDNHAKFRLQFKRLLGKKGPLAAMMTADEQAHYDLLPDTVTLYRGCSILDGNAIGGRGISWTLDPQIAKAFPHVQRYLASYPVLYKVTVPKNMILALKLDREEQEVLITAPIKPEIYHMFRSSQLNESHPWSEQADLVLLPERTGCPCADHKYVVSVAA